MAAVAIRIHDAYAIHLKYAYDALHRGDEITAAHELNTAVAMRPQSALAQRLRQRIDVLQPAGNACNHFLAFAGADKLPPTVCNKLACDGDTHPLMLSDDQKFSYSIRMDSPAPCTAGGELRKQNSAHLRVQALDEDGNELCNSDWNGKWSENLNTPTQATAAITPPDPLHPTDLAQTAPGAKPLPISACVH